MNPLTQVKTIGIIGAGEAGIATAKMLLSAGYECTVFERNDRLGGVWTDGYLDFGVQVQRELYEIPDFPLPKDAPDFTPGPVIQKYLEDYADHFGVTPHIRLNTTVTGLHQLAPNDPSSGWRITARTANGQKTAEDFDLVVVAIGVYSHTPHVPHFKDQQKFAGSILHNSQLKSRDQLKEKSVLVVGYGKSATDAAILAADHAKNATIAFREPRWPVPSILLGGIPFKYALFTRFTNAMLPLSLHASRLNKIWHRLGKPAIWLFWRLVEKFITFQCGLNRPHQGKSATKADLIPRHPIEYDGFSNSTMLPKAEFFDYLHDGNLGAQRAAIRTFTRTGAILTNGEFVACDTVILGTGWHTDYGFLPSSIRDRIGFEDDGFYLYRQIFHPDIPNLAFIGSNAATYINILTHNLQARWLTELLRGTHQLPDATAMRQEIEAMKIWKRRIIPPSKARAATLHLHMLPYHDTLLSDMGLSPRRKTGPLGPIKDFVAPYQPSDYAGVSSGADIASPTRTPSIQACFPLNWRRTIRSHG
ncbi:MAG: NAD(P)-binding domain-containing protein [Verrucomicrobiota bacterium]